MASGVSALVSRVMMEDNSVKLNAINAGPATTDYMAVINGGAKKVVSSAPAKNNSQVVGMGVNADKYSGNKNFVLCASCTTNGLRPMVGRVGEPHRVVLVVLRPQPSFKRLN